MYTCTWSIVSSKFKWIMRYSHVHDLGFSQHNSNMLCILSSCNIWHTLSAFLLIVHLRHHTCTTNVFIHIPFGHLSSIFGISITGNGIAECLSYFSCCSLKKATKWGEGLFWLTVQGYNPWGQGSYRSWRRPVTIEPQFRVESDTWWIFLFVQFLFM